MIWYPFIVKKSFRNKNDKAGKALKTNTPIIKEMFYWESAMTKWGRWKES